MSGGVRVREFTLAEVGLYRELRLAALQDAPDAFCATYAEEAARQDWPARLAENVNDERGRPVIARVDGTAAGLAVGKIWPAEPDVAQVYQMWVAPAFRGRGAARALLEDIIAGARGECGGARRDLRGQPRAPAVRAGWVQVRRGAQPNAPRKRPTVPGHGAAARLRSHGDVPERTSVERAFSQPASRVAARSSEYRRTIHFDAQPSSVHGGEQLAQPTLTCLRGSHTEQLAEALAVPRSPASDATAGLQHGLELAVHPEVRSAALRVEIAGVRIRGFGFDAPWLRRIRRRAQRGAS